MLLMPYVLEIRHKNINELWDFTPFVIFKYEIFIANCEIAIFWPLCPGS